MSAIDDDHDQAATPSGDGEAIKKRDRGTFHLQIPVRSGITANDLAIAFLACTRVRRILKTVTRRRGVEDDFDSVRNDTCIVVLQKLDIIREPREVYSYVYRTAQNLCFAAHRAGTRSDSAGVATDIDDVLEREEAASTWSLALPATSNHDTLVAKLPAETQQAQAIFSMKFARHALPAGVSMTFDKRRPGRPKTSERDLSSQQESALSEEVLELRRIRADLNLSVAEMATRFDIKPARMYSYLRGIVKNKEIMQEILMQARSILAPGMRPKMAPAKPKDEESV